MGLSLRNVSKKIIGFGEDAAKSAAAPFVSLAKTDIVDPGRSLVAQATGNRIAQANALRQQNVDLGLGARGTNFGAGARQLFGNVAQVGLDVAAPAIGGIGEKALAPIIPKVVPGIVGNTITKAATETALGVPQSEAQYLSTGQPVTLKGVEQNAIEGAKSGAEFGGAKGIGAPLLRAGTANFIGGERATDFQEAKNSGSVFTGAEGKPKFEGSDNKATVSRLQSGYNDNLSNVLHHPDLYKNYPDLANVKVSVQPLPAGARAVYVPGKDTIAVSPETAAHPTQFKSALLHETQHAIQNRENFAAGTNLSDNAAYQASAGEQEARQVQARMNMTPQERAANPGSVNGGIVNPLQDADAPSKTAVQAQYLSDKADIPKDVTDAVYKLQQHYKSPTEIPMGSTEDALKVANGYKATGARLANNLWKSLNKNLSSEEQEAVYDKLQGIDNPNMTPLAAKVYNIIKPLYGTANNVRKAVHGDAYNSVLNYAPRIERQSIGSALRSAGGITGKLKSIADLGNLDSVFSRSRQLGKFVDRQGKAVYGKATDLGLTKSGNGTYTDADGKVYRPTVTNTKELKANLGKDYLEKIGHVSGIYHADTTALKARADAVTELTTNPNAHGLYTEDQVSSGSAPSNVREIRHNDFKTPDGQKLYALPKDAKAIEGDPLLGRPETSGILGKAYDTLSNFATQSIVLNPVFHGMNQLYQTGIAAGNMPGMGTGWLKVANSVFKVNEDDIEDYLKIGGHSPTYGSTAEGILSNVTHGATKLNSKLMAGIELKLRVGLYKASVDSGMSKTEAVKNIDKFLGDSHTIPTAVRRTTLFAHYFKTMVGAMADQVKHPIEQRGSIVNTALLAALTAAVSYGYKEYTGNKNAYVRAPGEIGLAKELIGTGRDLAKGDIKDAADVATNRINPVLKEGLQQVQNEDFFTGNQTSDTAPVTIGGHTVIPGGRTGHAIQNLIAPAQQLEKGAGGKRSGTELASNQAGLYTPHAKGDVASPKVSLLNVKGDKVAPGNDATGYSQQQAYFAGKTAATKGLSQTDLTTYNQITASTSKMNNQQLQAHYALMASNPKILSIVTKQKQNYAKQTGTALDPLYGNGVTPEQRAEYFHLQSLPYKGDDYNQQVGANSAWLDKLNTSRNDYFNANPIAAADTSKSERIQTPTFSSSVENQLTEASSLQGADKAQYIAAHPQLTQAYDALAKYTNDKRVAQGNAPLKLYPDADPDTQAALNTYEGLGSSKERSAWIKANPDAYGKVQDYLTNVSTYELATSAGQDKFLGTNPSQEELKSAYSLGQYDIAKTTDANGNTVYQINPSLAYQQNSSSSGSSFDYASYEKSKLEKSRAQEISSGSYVTKPKAAKVNIKNATGGGTGKVSIKKPKLQKRTVALRKSKV